MPLTKHIEIIINNDKQKYSKSYRDSPVGKAHALHMADQHPYGPLGPVRVIP